MPVEDDEENSQKRNTEACGELPVERLSCRQKTGHYGSQHGRRREEQPNVGSHAVFEGIVFRQEIKGTAKDPRSREQQFLTKSSGRMTVWDIKRYEYEWADLWIIATFPSRHYDIESYPAVKNYLLSIGIERLEQTGETHIVNGKKIKARKKTSNEWFETQDSISYWEDFSKPKIIWGEISDKSKFAFDFLGEYIPEATSFYMKGECIEYLLSALNSSVSEWLFSKVGTTTGVGTIRWKKYTIEQLIVAKLSTEQLNTHLAAFNDLKVGKMSITDFECFSNKLMYDVYKLTSDEIQYIENQQIV